MTQLIVFKSQLKKIYSKYDLVIQYVGRFFFTLISLLVISAKTGYSTKFSGAFFSILIAAVCTFLPMGATVFILVGMILFQFYSLSIEYALIAAVVFALMFLLYFMFSTRTAFIILLTPILFILKIPYLLPIVIGLSVGIKGIVPIAFGIYTYFALDYSAVFATTKDSFGDDGLIQMIVSIIDNTIANKEMMVLIIVFAAVTILVSVVKKLSVEYSWLIAVGTGAIVEAILVLMSYVMLNLSLNIPMLIVGIILAMVCGAILDFFLFSVDYQRTEHVQFEDDDYYYYVKAIPKISVPMTEVKVKKINSRRNEEEKRAGSHNAYHEMYHDEQVYDEDEEEKNAYEQDINNLDEEE